MTPKGKNKKKRRIRQQSTKACFVEIDQWYASSKIYSERGCRWPKMSLKILSWILPKAGIYHYRDINVGKNFRQGPIIGLLAAGRSVTASEDLHQIGKLSAVVKEGTVFPIERKARTHIVPCGK